MTCASYDRTILVAASLLGLTGTWGGPAFARPLGATFLSGLNARLNAAMTYFSSDRNLDNKQGFLGATLHPRIKARLLRRTKVFASGWLTVPALNRSSSAQWLLRQAYVKTNFRGNELIVGQQIVAWGTADGVNPTDNLTPTNYTVLQTSTADERFGTPSLVWRRFFGRHYTLTSFVSDWFRPSVIPLPAVSGVRYANYVPGGGAENAEAALKVAYMSGSIDWSLSDFRGYDLVPNLVPGAQATADLVYVRTNVVGLAANAPIGTRYLGWIEASYTVPYRQTLPSGNGLQSNLYYVIGLERHLGGRVTLGEQLVGRYVPHYRPVRLGGPLASYAAERNAVINGELHKEDYGETTEVRAHWMNRTLLAKFFYYVNFRPVNSYLRLVISYNASDHITETLGAEDFWGPEDSYFGSLKQNRTVFAQWEYALS